MAFYGSVLQALICSLMGKSDFFLPVSSGFPYGTAGRLLLSAPVVKSYTGLHKRASPVFQEPYDTFWWEGG